MLRNNRKMISKKMILGIIVTIVTVSIVAMIVTRAYFPDTYKKFVGIVFPNHYQDENNCTAEESEQNINSQDENTFQTIDNQDNKYRLEVEYYDTQIKENSQNADFYGAKSDALYNLGQKEQAIDTIENGLMQNPDDELLKSKLDVIKKEWFSDPDEETPKG